MGLFKDLLFINCCLNINCQIIAQWKLTKETNLCIKCLFSLSFSKNRRKAHYNSAFHSPSLMQVAVARRQTVHHPLHSFSASTRAFQAVVSCRGCYSPASLHPLTSAITPMSVWLVWKVCRETESPSTCESASWSLESVSADSNLFSLWRKDAPRQKWS